MPWLIFDQAGAAGISGSGVLGSGWAGNACAWGDACIASAAVDCVIGDYKLRHAIGTGAAKVKGGGDEIGIELKNRGVIGFVPADGYGVSGDGIGLSQI